MPSYRPCTAKTRLVSRRGQRQPSGIVAPKVASLKGGAVHSFSPPPLLTHGGAACSDATQGDSDASKFTTRLVDRRTLAPCDFHAVRLWRKLCGIAAARLLYVVHLIRSMLSGPKRSTPLTTHSHITVVCVISQCLLSF